jgi:hypothetical protein
VTQRAGYDPTTGHRVHRFTAGEIIDQRGDLAARLGDHTPFGQAVTEQIRLMLEKYGNFRHLGDSAQGLAGMVRHHIKQAEAFRVSADMMTLLDAAAAQLNDLDRLDVGKFPTTYGFARLDRPLAVRDIHGREMLTHALCWGPLTVRDTDTSAVTTGITLSMWNDTVTEPDSYAREIAEWDLPRELRESAGRWSLVGVDIFSDDMRAGPSRYTVANLPANIRDSVPKHLAQDGVTATNTLRWIIALLEMLNQTVVEIAPERPNVHARRRAKERKQSRGDVTVIQLRRPKRVRDDRDQSHGDGHVEWESRWVVRGHWRRQRVGEGRREIRRTWVSPHIKGPEDKPLVVRDKLYDIR